MKKKIIGAVSGSIVVLGFGVTALGSAFTAPGLTVNGVEVGMVTTSSAEKELNKTFLDKTLKINDETFTYGELGFSYDNTLDETLSNNKMLNAGSWNSSINQGITVDEQKFEKAVSQKIDKVYSDPVDAEVVLNEEGDEWVVVESKKGTRPVIEDLRKSIEEDISKTSAEVKSYDLKIEEIEPKVNTEAAENFAEKINKMADEAGYYEGDELKLDISRSSFAELVKVEKTEDGFKVVPLEDSLRNYAETVPEAVNKKADNGSAVVDENGKVLKTLDEWQDGYEFNDVEGLTTRSIEQLNNGESAKFTLNGKTTESKVDKKFRRVEVNLDERRVRTFENDKLVKTYEVAVGKPSTPTDRGDFRVFYQTKKQDMGCTARYDYCTKDVPFATFYNGGEAFHGAWWHNDFGDPNGSMRSHGCVNMKISEAEEIYYFAQVGTPVKVI